MQSIPQLITDIFRNGSKTYYYSSLFFPSNVKKDVFTLYSFVRVADDFVDSTPQQKKAFLEFRKQFEKGYAKKKSGNFIIDEFIKLMKKHSFEKKWVDAFLDAMEKDLTKKSYETLKEVEVYMYGSAEVIGLMMAKILHLPKESYPGARLLGKAMQYANFIRDIQEDLDLKRQYLPVELMKAHDLTSLSHNEVIVQKQAFIDFMQDQIFQYRTWQKEAEASFHYIPYRYRIPIQTASEMYKWTMDTIFQDPFIVYEKKVKPSIFHIIQTIIKNSVILLFKK